MINCTVFCKSGNSLIRRASASIELCTIMLIVELCAVLYQRGRISLGLNEARDDGVWGWQWQQLDSIGYCGTAWTPTHTVYVKLLNMSASSGAESMQRSGVRLSVRLSVPSTAAAFRSTSAAGAGAQLPAELSWQHVASIDVPRRDLSEIETRVHIGK